MKLSRATQGNGMQPLHVLSANQQPGTKDMKPCFHVGLSKMALEPIVSLQMRGQGKSWRHSRDNEGRTPWRAVFIGATYFAKSEYCFYKANPCFLSNIFRE